MGNRILIGLGITALFLVVLLNVIPLFWSADTSRFIHQDQIAGMAVIHDGLPYTFNFDEQKRTIDILNRAIPLADYAPVSDESPLEFTAFEIYRFDKDPLVIQPLGWVSQNLVFRAKEWSDSPLKEVSHGELFDIVNSAYDKGLPQKSHH